MPENKFERLIRFLDALIAEGEREQQRPKPGDESPRCYYCGTTKRYDLFKGEYCPKCNDWV